MIVKLKKQTATASGTLTCIRSDGSITWQASSAFFAEHDLYHFAVESVLGYNQAFFGLLAAGRDIDSFGTRNGAKDTYNAEEMWAESLVGCLQWPQVGGGEPLSTAEVLQQLTVTFQNSSLGIPPITSEQVQKIRNLARALQSRWAQLGAGEILELRFPITANAIFADPSFRAKACTGAD